MTILQPASGDDWKQQLDPACDPDALLTVLEELSTQEDVSGIALSCLQLLAHDDSEVRVWAAEALETAALPTGNETDELVQWLEKLLEQQAATVKKGFVWPGAGGESEPSAESQGSSTEELADSLLADQLYWTATMLGRIGADAQGADAVLARLESLGESSNKVFHAAAARAAAMRRRISS